MSDEVPSLADLQKQRVVDLKKELARLGLAQGGVKADLVARLNDYYQEKAGDDSEPASEEPTPDQSAEPSREPSPEPSAEPSPEPEQVEESPEPESVEQSPEPEAAIEPADPVEEASPEPESEEPTPDQSAEPSREQSPEPEQEEEVTPEPEEPAEEVENETAMEQDEAPTPKVSLQFAPPKQHPAGAPPVQQEEFTPVQQADEPEDTEQDEYGSGQYNPEEEEAAPMEEAPAPASPVKASPVKASPVKASPVRAAPAPQAYVPPVQEEEDEDEEEEIVRPGKDKKERKKKPKKKKKKNRPEQWAMQAVVEQRRKMEEERAKTETQVDVEYIQEELALEPSDPLYRTFNKIFQAFKIQEEPKEEEVKEEEDTKPNPELSKVPKLMEEDDLEENDKDDDGTPKISKRKLKQLSRLSVAELKQLVSRPDVVEMHDVTARDPRLLVHLKSTRNTVPVPRHWCFKRKYLQGKRGIEKPPFDLPEFIKKTGIMEMREALQEKEDAKGMKSKMREKVRPKLGKIDIDYQKLHDAFFKWQTKPRMTMHGDLYYEGKEFEIRLKEKKPGDLTDDLRTALGMPVGPNAHKVPPPWLIAMQRYGPPPSYPNLKCPGLNAPIPEGCSFGYHAGGWGKPPVDEAGKPLYGDVFGTSDSRNLPAVTTEDIDQTLWGEMESESEEESDSDEDDDEEGEGEEDSGLQTPVVGEGLATPSGTASVGGAGLETPDMIELRKRRIEADMEGGETPSLPYTVIPERSNARIGASMMGSTHTYDIKGGARPPPGGQARGAETPIEMALNPEEIDLMDSDAMALKAEAVLREQQASLAKEDLSDMVAEHAAKQRNKRKRQEAKDDKDKSKKYKEFKF